MFPLFLSITCKYACSYMLLAGTAEVAINLLVCSKGGQLL